MCSQQSGEVWASNSAGTACPCAAQVIDGISQVGRIPVDDGGDHQVEAGGPELLRVLTAVRDAPLLEGADHLGDAWRCSLLFRPAGRAGGAAATPASPA